MKNTVIHTPIDKLLIYSLISEMPRWADDSEDMQALAADIKARGIEQPLFAVKTDHGHSKKDHYYVVDGRHRFFAAKIAGLKEVPVIVRDEAEASDIILHSLTQRRHLTKGQQAYICYPVIADGLNGNGVTNHTGKSFDAAADSLGFSRDLLFQAKKLHEYFSDHAEMREKYEPRLLSGELALNLILRAAKGEEATSGKGREDDSEKNLLMDAFHSVTVRVARAWSTAEPSDRLIVCHKAASEMATWPEDLRKVIRDTLNQSLKK